MFLCFCLLLYVQSFQLCWIDFSEGIGRKTQRKVQKLEKRLEISELNNRTSRSDLEQIAKEAEKLRLEKEALENLVSSLKQKWKKMLLIIYFVNNEYIGFGRLNQMNLRRRRVRISAWKRTYK